MDYKDYPDSELMYMISESSDEAKDIIYEKYKYIIDIIFNKYKNMARLLNIETSDLYQEAMLGFSDALKSYKDDKDTSLPTFITICVERRLQVTIIKAGRLKHKFINDSLSLEEVYGEYSVPLMEMISDNDVNNPLNNLMNEEGLKELIEAIKDELSDAEYEVYQLKLNGFGYAEIATLLDKNLKSVDNTMQRIRAKIRKILDNR